MSSNAQNLLAKAVVWDNHGCMPLRLDDTFLPQLERYRRSGVTVVSLNVGFGDLSWEAHLQVLSFMRRWLSTHSDHFALISTVDDVSRCKAEGKLGIVFDVEGMVPVQDHPHLVQTFYELGVRWMLVAYKRCNRAGAGCLDQDDEGLTATGGTIIDEMDRVGMVLCLSHTGPRTASEALEYSRNPVIFSHSNPHSHTAHPRNVSDALMKAVARKGGIIGLSGLGPFVGSNEQVTEHLLAQLRYAIDLVGAKHVGLGLDYVFDRSELDEYLRQNPHVFPAALNLSGRIGIVAPEAMIEIAEGLARAHLTDTEILGILGQNWLRVATQVWR